jgi:hypothetical protein
MTAKATRDHRSGCLTAGEVLEQARTQDLVTLDEHSLNALLEGAEIIRDEDTCLAGRIRILHMDGTVMVQEQTQEGRILVRRLGSYAAAKSFVDDRLATYERMWDGCGCKVDYDRQPEGS